MMHVLIVDVDPPLLVVLGKAEDQMDLSAEKLSVEQASRVLAETGQALGVRVLDFLVCPVPGTLLEEKLAHEWIIECDPQPADPAAFARELEERLCAQSPMYRELRVHDFALARPRLTFVARGTFARYMEAELQFGQQKMMHMRHDRQAAERLLTYACSQ